jgi:hypothetical protein
MDATTDLGRREKSLSLLPVIEPRSLSSPGRNLDLAMPIKINVQD